MDASEAGYSFIRQLDGGASVQDSLRLGPHRDTFLNPKPLPPSLQRSGDDLHRTHQARAQSCHATRSDQQDLRHHPAVPRTYQHPPPATGPGWPSSCPPKKKPRHQNKKKGSTQGSSHEQGNGGAVMPGAKQPVPVGGANMGQTTKKSKKNKNKKATQRHTSIKRAGGYPADPHIPSKQLKTHQSRVQKHGQATWKAQLPPAAPSAPASKNPFLSKMKSRKLAAMTAGPSQQQSPELHGLSSDESSEGKAPNDDTGACEHQKKHPSSSIECEHEARMADSHHGAAERPAAYSPKSKEQPSRRCTSASMHAEADKAGGRSSESCATNALQDCQQPLHARHDKISLASRIRKAQTGSDGDIGVSRVHLSAAPSSTCQPEEINRPQPSAPAAKAVVVQRNSPTSMPPIAKKGVQQPAKPVIATSSVQSPAEPPIAKKSKQPPVTKQGTHPVCAGQPTSSQSHLKQSAKRVRPVADDHDGSPDKQRKQGQKTPAVRGTQSKHPHIDLASSVQTANPAVLDTSAEATAAKATAPQPMPWGSPSPVRTAQPVSWGRASQLNGAEGCTLSPPPKQDIATAVPGDGPKRVDGCTHAEKSPAPSNLPQQSATDLLQQWMVQEEPSGAGSLLQAWCALASAEADPGSTLQPENCNAGPAGDEQGSACHRLGTDAGCTKQSNNTATPAANPQAAQKSRFHPTGRTAKKPSIQLSFDSCAASTAAQDSPHLQSHHPPTRVQKTCAGEQPTVEGASVTDDRTTQSDAAPAGCDAPSGDVQLSETDGLYAVLQQPDAATLNIMLQNIAKHGSDGSSTAKIPTRLLQSITQCMDKLVQQQSKQTEQPANAPIKQDAPETTGQPAQCQDAEHSRMEPGLQSEQEVAPLYSEQAAHVAQSGSGEGVQPLNAAPSDATAHESAATAADEPDVSACAAPAASCGAQQRVSEAGGQPAVAGVAQPQCNSPPFVQQEASTNEAVKRETALLMQRERNVEVEEMEWARRQAELEKQRRAAQAERRARAEQNAVVRARAQREKEQAEVQQRAAMRIDLQVELSRVVLPGMSLRQALVALGFHPGPGADGERAALKQARVFYHPDSSRRRGDTLRQQIMSEEIFKILGSLV